MKEKKKKKKSNWHVVELEEQQKKTEPCTEDILQKQVGQSACVQPLWSTVQCNCNKTYLKHRNGMTRLNK